MKDRRKFSLEDCQSAATLFGGACLNVEYKSTKTYMTWKCSFGHVWQAIFKNIKKNHWCPVCAGTKRKTIEHCIAIATQKHGKCLSEDYENNRIKLAWECKENHIFHMTYSDVYSGRWCPRCATTRRKQTCMKKYGEISAQKTLLVREKTKQTNLKRYGVEYPLQNREIALKNAKSSNNSGILFHWKTNEEIVWHGSYERKVINYLNLKKIDFKWQPKTFITPFLTPKGSKSVYTPDLYLVCEDLWIEIKGYMREDAQEKWDWFHNEYPNSELWNKKKLKEIQII